MMTLSIAQEFTVAPGPRYKADGPHSGEQFLQTILEPRYLEAVRRNEKLSIDLDGTEGYATSFLEEAFGGLARRFGPEAVRATLDFISQEEPYLIDEVRGYIDKAIPGK